MNFKRYYQKGQIVFITQVVENRKPVLNQPELISLLFNSWHRIKDRRPFSMLAYIILPDHFHFLIQPSGESNFSQIMHSIKLSFTNKYKRQINAKTPFSFWQKRFWDHVIRNENDLENHIHYIHFNPVKHGYVTDPNQWKYSSFHEWQHRGLYDIQEQWVEPKEENWGE
jgi:putative transposase